MEGRCIVHAHRTLPRSGDIEEGADVQEVPVDVELLQGIDIDRGEAAIVQGSTSSLHQASGHNRWHRP